MLARIISSNALVLATLLPASGDTITFDGSTFPEALGWERVGTFDADRWIESGTFNQYVNLGVWGPPPVGETDYYQRSIAEFSGQPFFIEWRVMSNAPRSEIDGVGGAALSAVGFGSLYHFTIASDQVRFLRDVSLPILWIDIEPEIFHKYRLEIDGDTSAKWFIDEQLVVSDIPEGVFPNKDADLGWGAKYWEAESTNVWDYITYGTLPEPMAALPLLLYGSLSGRRRHR